MRSAERDADATATTRWTTRSGAGARSRSTPSGTWPTPDHRWELEPFHYEPAYNRAAVALQRLRELLPGSHDDGPRRRRARQQAPPRRQRLGAHELGRGAARRSASTCVFVEQIARRRLRRRRRRARRRSRARANAATFARGDGGVRLRRRARRSSAPTTASVLGMEHRGAARARSARRRCSSTSAATCAGAPLLARRAAARLRRPRPRLHPDLARRRAATRPALDGHDLHFTVGANVGTPGCALPTGGLRWRPIRQPVVLDRWPRRADGAATSAGFTTVASWRGAFGRRCGRAAATGSRPTSSAASRPAAQRPALPFEIALDIHPGDAPTPPRCARGGWQLRRPARVVGDSTASATTSAARAPSSRSRRASTSRRAAAGSATAPSATSPRAARRSCRTPASPTPARPARACSPSARPRRRAPARARSSPTTRATAPPRARSPRSCFAPAPALAPLLEATGVAPPVPGCGCGEVREG